MKRSERPGAIVAIVLLALGALSLLLWLIWNDRLVAVVFNAGQAVSYHFAPIVALARTLVLVKGIVLVGLGALAWRKRMALSRWMRRHRAQLMNAATLLITLAILLLIGEVVARIALSDTTYDGGGPAHKRQLGEVAYNSFGFRDKEYPVEKDGAYVVVVLGDSFTFGEGIRNDSELWPEIIEDTLNRGDREYRVINTAKVGLQTEDEFKELERATVFKPDLVVLQYFLNDGETDEQILHRGADSESIPGKIASGVHLFLFSNSYFYSYLYVRWQNAKINLGLADSYTEAIDRVYREHNLTLHTQELLKVKDLSESTGARFMIVVVPGMYDFSDYPLEDGHAFMRTFCATYNVTCVDALDRFRSEDYRRTRMNPYDAHPSPYGHTIIAQTLLNSTAFRDAAGAA